jgi:MFS family permease
MVVGIALSYSAVLVPQLEREGSDIPVTKFLTSLVASIIVLMVPIGSIIAGYLMDSVGRVNTIKLAAIPSLLGLVLIAMAPNVYFILAGRIFTGIACAMGTSPAVRSFHIFKWTFTIKTIFRSFTLLKCLEQIFEGVSFQVALRLPLLEWCLHTLAVR